MDLKKLPIILAILFFMAGCSPIEQNARDTAAALNGALTAAEAKHAECKSSPKLRQCEVITRAVDGQNALVTAIEAYCGWSVLNPPLDRAATCKPVKSARAGLISALGNANLFISELKGLVE